MKITGNQDSGRIVSKIKSNNKNKISCKNDLIFDSKNEYFNKKSKVALTSRIARNFAHEIRNPLTNINLAIEQIKQELNEKNELVSAYIEILNRNSLRINQLVTELINSSRPADLLIEKASVSNILNDCLSDLNPLLVNKKIEIIKDYEPETEILVDKVKLKLVFNNIILNSIEAIENGDGTIKLELFSHSNKLIAKISDNGKGITAEDLNKIFDPFYSKKSNSRGLGLNFVQNIVIAHKGQIDISSVYNKGTTVILIFPLL